jgi:hypothetical protein
MWVKGALLHFIFDRGSQNNLISVEVDKQLDLLKTPLSQNYTIRWLLQGRDLCVIQQCRLPYHINHFKDEVLCDIYPLEFCDIILGQTYLWKHHAMYEFIPCSFIITLGIQLYKIPEVAPPMAIYLISAKQCRKVISQTNKFFFFIIFSQSE